MIKKKVFSKKGNLVTDNPVALILVVLVIASVLMFLYKVDINKYLRNLPGYSSIQGDSEVDLSGEGDERTEIVESVQGDECVKNAYWAYEDSSTTSRDFIKIDEGGKMGPQMDIYLVIIINDFSKCNHKINIIEASKSNDFLLTEKSSENQFKKDKENIYYYRLKEKFDGGDIQEEISKGKYSFKIKDSFGEKVLGGYSIDVGDLYDNSRISTDTKRGDISNILNLVFHKGRNDHVYLKWSFDKQTPRLNIRPNGETLFELNKEKVFEDEASLNDFGKPSTIYLEDWLLIKNIVGSKDKDEFAENIVKAINSRRASIDNSGIYHLSVENVYEKLFGITTK